MEQKQNRTVWIVGASQGIGLAVTRQLLDSGFTVVASSRKATQSLELIQLQKRFNSGILHLLDCDITEENLQSYCQQAWELAGGLDYWFYNVGLYQPMTVSEWDWNAFDSMNQSNYLGAVKLMIPLQQLQARHSKPMRWLWNISLAADFGLPYGGGYSAPKAALLNLAESIAPELARQHIKLQVINHGFVKTRLTAKNRFAMPGLMEAEEAACKIVPLFEQNRFELRFPWTLSILLGMLKRLPKSWSLSINKRMLKDG
ncbi:SDR family NAD(P)-dependent oxidoreductase [Thiomicrorhabdus xiamenensis]|uniref:SDR family NAD(P)-dependent oxidoreductase n=1 Tax=Thiomicrorhabdus xiamenensis TaxID=2739063 RepID=A0A7D4T9E7_9GAMM|nr:SDR family NAD(P)-dependent oxidoreductase [Thiomicrorhabdus xiamenensis]QKI88486.1 SDR family NAD(P)-dependent oxidoreductase [Thiomicrorhabdus xiamenensis]